MIPISNHGYKTWRTLPAVCDQDYNATPCRHGFGAQRPGESVFGARLSGEEYRLEIRSKETMAVQCVTD